MADNREKKGPADSSRINVSEVWERAYWAKKWGVSEDQLIKAVGAVGPMVDDVARRVGKSAS
jgi:hypothetical protein